MRDVILLIARVLLALLFLSGGLPKIAGDPGEREDIAKLGLPAAGLLERATGVIVTILAVALAIGAWARLAATFLSVFVVVVTPLFLHFWTIKSTQPRVRMQQGFFSNLGVLGGLLAFTAVGPGNLAIYPAW